MLSKKLVLIALSAVLLSACQAIGSGEDSVPTSTVCAANAA